MAKQFYDNDVACDARRCSSSARTAIAGIATAAPRAANKPAGSSDGAPTGATNRVWRDGSTIVIGSRHTDAAAGKRHPA